MLKFFLVEEVKIERPGTMLKIVIPFGLITFGDIKKVIITNENIMIDSDKFKIISYEDDLLPHETHEQFTFCGHAMFGLFVGFT